MKTKTETSVETVRIIVGASHAYVCMTGTSTTGGAYSFDVALPGGMGAVAGLRERAAEFALKAERAAEYAARCRAAADILKREAQR